MEFADPLPTAGPTRKRARRQLAIISLRRAGLATTDAAGGRTLGADSRAGHSTWVREAGACTGLLRGQAQGLGCPASQELRGWVVPRSKTGQAPLPVRPRAQGGRITGILTRRRTQTTEAGGRASEGLLPSSCLLRGGHPGTHARPRWVESGRSEPRPSRRRPHPGAVRGRGAGAGRGERGAPGMPRGARLPAVGGAGVRGGRKLAEPPSRSAPCTSGGLEPDSRVFR